MKTKIIVTDDHILFAQGLVQLINSFPDFEVTATAGNGQELLTLLNNRGTDSKLVLLLDICMPKLNGLKTIGEIKARYPHCKILVCTMYVSKDLLAELQCLGADGLISKNTDAAELAFALRELEAGKSYFRILPEKNGPASETLPGDAYSQIQQLTKTERELLVFIKAGLTSREIAEKLHRSETTIQTHRSNICQKLKLSGNQLVLFAAQCSLTDLV
jgi:DNA-binding NarL/FixJ family response regulator